MTANRKITVGKAVSIDEQEKVLTAVMSTRSVDRDGDIVEAGGMQIDNFKNNPVVLWAHDKKKPPIGKVTEILRSDEAVLGKVEFDKNDPFAMLVFEKYAKGYMNAWSIGFDPSTKDTEPLIDGESGQITGYHFKNTELLELSAVPVPANADALVRSMKDADGELVKRFADGLDDDDLRKAIEKVFTLEDHSNETADNEPGWGNVDKAALPEVSFVWEAPGTETDKKSTWKYPHHWIENAGNKNEAGIWTTGQLKLHEGGLRAAWAAAMGARSDSLAPASVINHLQAHRKALGLVDEERGKMYLLTLGTEGRTLLKEKDFDEVAELSEDYGPAELYGETDMELGPNVFKKSLDERADKIPTVYSLGDGFEVRISLEAIQVSDGLIKEARMVLTEVTLPKPAENAELPHDEASPADKEAEAEGDADVTPEVDADDVIDELEADILGISARIADL